MKRKILTGIVLALMLVGLVSAFSLGDLPKPSPIKLLSTQVHEQHGFQLNSIVFNEPMQEEGIVTSCIVTAIYNDFHIQGGKTYCGIAGTSKFNVNLLIQWSYDSSKPEPDTFRVNYRVENKNGEVRFDSVEIKKQ